MFDRSSLYKEKIVCTYNDIIQIPDYTICQTIKSNKSNFDFYIDTDKLDKYNDDTLFRLVLARTEKDIFQCLRKSSVKYLPEFQKGIYNVINNLYEVAPILNTINMINTIGKMKDLVHQISFIVSDKRQIKRLNELIDPAIQYETIYDYEPLTNIVIDNSTIIISDNIDLIIDSFNKDLTKRYLIPITGYTAKKVDSTYILSDNIMPKIKNLLLLSAITFYESFDFEEKHLI